MDSDFSSLPADKLDRIIELLTDINRVLRETKKDTSPTWWPKAK